jgi:copper chaperone
LNTASTRTRSVTTLGIRASKGLLFHSLASTSGFHRNIIMEHLFLVQGMTCGHCERAVANAINEVDSGAQVHIDRAKNQVIVISRTDREAIAHAIAEEGYQVAD